MMPGRELVFSRVQDEITQSHETRKPLIHALQDEFGRTVVTYFTSFKYPIGVSDSDADVIENILQDADLKNGLILFVDSPGGDGLAAERIINVCRSYSGTGEYWCLVAGKAKSAATMIAFGASKIIMCPTSELGPVDPQWLTVEDGEQKRFSAYNVVESYEDLFERATKETGNLQPYVQQLQRYDEREIEELRSAIALSEDISVRSLATGMMDGVADEQIRDRIRTFLTPERTKDHGRPIYADEAEKCGLNIDVRDVDSDLWRTVHKLYFRTSNFVIGQYSKCIESIDHPFYSQAGIQR
jgi:ATP-dependent protease ClpP protease subunit